MAIDKAEALMIDYDRAKRHIEDYIELLQNQITARGLILNGAIEEYNSFRKLPASSSLAGAIWDAAFGALSLVVPALRLGPFIKQQYAFAVIAIEITEAIGNKARAKDKMVKVATGGAQVGAKLAKGIDDVKGLVEKVGKLSAPAQEMVKHASRRPILELIKDLYDATALWTTAKQAVAKEWEQRVDDIWPPAAGYAGQGGVETLEAMAKRLLPSLPATYGPEDLKEIWTRFLYLIMKAHVGQEVKVITTISDYGYGQRLSSTSIEGINDTQWKQIVTWFGPGVPRKKHFLEPPVKSLSEFVGRFPHKTETKYKNEAGWTRVKI